MINQTTNQTPAETAWNGQTAPAGSRVWVLSLSWSSGDEVTAHTSEAGAKRALAQFARKRWPEVAGREECPDTPPAEDDEVSRLYFATTEDGWFVISHPTVQGGDEEVRAAGQREGDGKPVVTITRHSDEHPDVTVAWPLDEWDTVAVEFAGIPYVLVTPQGVGWWPDPEDTWQRLHTGGKPVNRTVWLEGLNSEAAWRDLEKHLRLPEHGLGQFIDWTGSRKFESGERIDLDALMEWAWRNGLDHEDHRVIRYEPNTWKAQELTGLAWQLRVHTPDRYRRLVQETFEAAVKRAGQGASVQRIPGVSGVLRRDPSVDGIIRFLVEQLGPEATEAHIRALAAETGEPTNS